MSKQDKNTFEEQMSVCQATIKSVADMINNEGLKSNEINYSNLHNAIYDLIPLIPTELSIFRDRLRDEILRNIKSKDVPSKDNFGRQVLIPNNGINPYYFGEVISTFGLMSETIQRKRTISFWVTIHTDIKKIAKSRFDNKHYADAVESAFKEINIRVKKIVKDKTSREYDGANLMRTAFSSTNPIIRISDMSTESERNVQQGYMEMFAGAMTGIRNPKAHGNQTIKEEDAIRKLNFASMLMFKIDNKL